MHLAALAWQSAWRNSASHHTAFKQHMYSNLRQQIKNMDLEPDAVTLDWVSSEASFQREFETLTSLIAMSAGLLHDIGHTPFSHSLEDFYERYLDRITEDSNAFYPTQWRKLLSDVGEERPFHEVIGLEIVSTIPLRAVSNLPWTVVKIVLKAKSNDASWAGCFKQLVSAEVDVDRLDYLLRDSAKSGTEFGVLDRDRLIQSFELHFDTDKGRWQIGFGARALSAIESFLTQRLQYYRWVVFHWHSIAENRLLNLALEMMAKSDPAEPNWIRRLNYFARRDTSAGRSSVLDLSETDDSTIRELIRSARREAAIETSPSYSKKFLSVAETLLHRAPLWASVWKTDFDYEAVASDLQPALIEQLGNLAVALDEQLAILDDPADQEAILVSRRRRNVEASIQALRANPVSGLNDLAGRLLHTSESRRVHPREMDLAEELDAYSHPDGPIPSGYWVIAYQPFEAVKFLDDATGIYFGSQRRTAFEVSPIVTGLSYADARRPQFYVYYISDNPSVRLRDGRRSLYGPQIRATFLTAFPQAVSNLFRKSAGGIASKGFV